MKNQQGFTLIETLLYIALFTIIMGGAFIATLQIIEASGSVQEKALIEEEGHFLVSKINWALTGADVVNLPSPGIPGATLDIDKFDGSNVTLDGINPNLLIQPGNTPLNSENVSVQNVTFTYIDPIGTKPAAVQATFRISGKLTAKFQDFSTTKYLRR
ncbi:MAG: type II secretion system protein [Candidatus Doudnabacteria bacterium]|nr:type II secretion system protein [Candidatus Doudnabacteria bacterium]